MNDCLVGMLDILVRSGFTHLNETVTYLSMREEISRQLLQEGGQRERGFLLD